MKKKEEEEEEKEEEEEEEEEEEGIRSPCASSIFLCAKKIILSELICFKRFSK